MFISYQSNLKNYLGMFIDLIFLQLTKLIWKIFNYNFKVIELNQTNNDSHITIWNNFK